MTSDYTGDAFKAEDLVLSTDNDYHLAMVVRPEFMLKMVRKMIRGTFEPNKAIKLWERYAKTAADSYARQVGRPGDTGARLFDKATRRLAAVEFYKDAFYEIRDDGGPVKWKAEHFPERRN